MIVVEASLSRVSLRCTGFRPSGPSLRRSAVRVPSRVPSESVRRRAPPAPPHRAHAHTRTHTYSDPWRRRGISNEEGANACIVFRLRIRIQMSEYWVSQAKYYCKICNVWIADNVMSKQLHHAGTKHKMAVEELNKKKREEKLHGARSEREIKQQLADIEKAAREAIANDRLENAGYFQSSSSSSSGSLGRAPPPPPPPLPPHLGGGFAGPSEPRQPRQPRRTDDD
jgi:U1 zinc finger